jgi:hypothetical protein
MATLLRQVAVTFRSIQCTRHDGPPQREDGDRWIAAGMRKLSGQHKKSPEFAPSHPLVSAHWRGGGPPRWLPHDTTPVVRERLVTRHLCRPPNGERKVSRTSSCSWRCYHTFASNSYAPIKHSRFCSAVSTAGACGNSRHRPIYQSRTLDGSVRIARERVKTGIGTRTRVTDFIIRTLLSGDRFTVKPQE